MGRRSGCVREGISLCTAIACPHEIFAPVIELVPGVFVCYERPPLQCMDQEPIDILSHTIIWSHDKEVTRSYGLLAKGKAQSIYCIVSINQPGNLSGKQERGPLF